MVRKCNKIIAKKEIGKYCESDCAEFHPEILNNSEHNNIKGIKHIHIDNTDEYCCCESDKKDKSKYTCGCDEDDKIHAPHMSCGCSECCHANDEDVSGLSKILLAVGVLFLVLAVITSFFKIRFIPQIFYFISYISIGYKTFQSLVRALKEKQFFGETTLMTVSSLGAMIIGEMIEGCMVMLLFRFGEILEHKAIEKSEDNIKRLLEMSPKIAERILPDGTVEKVSPTNLVIGDIVLVKAGGTIPCDGEVIEGCTNTDTSSITGESVPMVAERGSSVRCGYISLDGSLKVKVTSSYEDNSFSRILNILSENNKRKSKSETFFTKFARLYTPIVIALALVIVAAGSIITEDISSWIYKGLVFLATSCPCAFVISVPLTFFFGLGECAKNGLLVKGSEYIEKTSKINVVAFDKTGTLTKGEPVIVSVITALGYDENTIISYCASLEKNSNHPIAAKIVEYAEDHSVSTFEATDILEIPGEGISGIVNGKKIKCGNHKIIKSDNILKTDDNTTKVYILLDETPIGVIQLSDTVKPEAPEVMRNLKKLGISRILMLTGDNEGSSAQTAEMCGITEVFSCLEPHEKAKITEQAKSENTKGITAFIGDGINDAPVLSVADVGIAVGSTGSDICVETADVVILGSTLEVLPKGIRCTRKIMSRVKFNISFALIVKALILILAVFGIANMWTAVFGDVGITVIVILNALRKIRIK